MVEASAQTQSVKRVTISLPESALTSDESKTELKEAIKLRIQNKFVESL